MKFNLNAGCVRLGGIASLLFGLALALAGPAAAHHPTGKRMPATFLDGFLSGIGHPVIGPDHLAFIVTIGIAAALVPAGVSLIVAFIATSTAGVLIHAATRLDVPLSEPLIALSVVAAGALVALGRKSAASSWLALAAVAGLCHGYAFGETVVGAERAVIGAYLAGLALIATVIAFATMHLAPSVLALADATSPRRRTAGAVISCIGLAVLASQFGAG